MRWLILNTDYPAFLRCHYARHPGLADASYAEQLRARADTLFGVADFYSANLQRLGEQAEDVHVNNEALQRAWARENGLALRAPGRALQWRWRRGAVPWPAFGPDRRWQRTVLAAQIRTLQPDIVWNHDPQAISGRFLRRLLNRGQILIGQVASPYGPRTDFSGYDLLLSSLPNFVERFCAAGLPGHLHRFGFEPSVLDRVPALEPAIPVSFVGALSPAHQSRIGLLEAVSAAVPLQIWGPDVSWLPPQSPLRACHNGAAWGRDMYAILRRSRIAINHHLDAAGPYANNMRLFEATGAGTLLLTDAKQNLGDLFAVGSEVVHYHTPAECAERVRHYLAHEEERAAIARAGQARTLAGHTYRQRMEELVALVRPLR